MRMMTTLSVFECVYDQCVPAQPKTAGTVKQYPTVEECKADCKPENWQFLCCSGTFKTKPWCKGYSPDVNKSACDPVMKEYCEKNPTDARCGCFLSKTPYAHCFDKICGSPGVYRFQNQSDPCPCRLSCSEFSALSETDKGNVVNDTAYLSACNSILKSFTSSSETECQSKCLNTKGCVRSEYQSDGWCKLFSDGDAQLATGPCLRISDILPVPPAPPVSPPASRTTSKTNITLWGIVGLIITGILIWVSFRGAKYKANINARIYKKVMGV